MTITDFCDHAQGLFPGVDPSNLSRGERLAIIRIFRRDFLPRTKLQGVEAIKCYVVWVHQHRALVRAVAQAFGRGAINDGVIARQHVVLAARAERLAERVGANGR